MYNVDVNVEQETNVLQASTFSMMPIKLSFCRATWASATAAAAAAAVADATQSTI